MACYDEKWEEIAGDTYRLKVFGGWLVRDVDDDIQAACMCFVPDKKHAWVAGV